MARFDVHRGAGRGSAPFLLDVQANLLSAMATRVVIPLVPQSRKKDRIARLNLLVSIEGETHVLLPELMAATDRRSLGRVVTSLADRHDEIVGAIDFLLQGF